MQPDLRFIAAAQQSARRVRFTPREVQVLELAQCQRADIAALLGLSESTVKIYLRRLYDIVGVDTRAALVEWREVAWRERRAA